MDGDWGGLEEGQELGFGRLKFRMLDIHVELAVSEQLAGYVSLESTGEGWVAHTYLRRLDL